MSRWLLDFEGVEIRGFATICRCTTSEIPLQKPLHLQFLTIFMVLMSQIIINSAITTKRPRRRARRGVSFCCCKTVALKAARKCNSMIFTGLDGSKRVPVFPQRASQNIPSDWLFLYMAGISDVMAMVSCARMTFFPLYSQYSTASVLIY